MSGGPVAQSRVVVELGTERDPALIRYWPAPEPERYGSAVSYALHTTAGWVFLDPLPPPAGDVDRLRRLIRERPVATVLTSDGHERFCYAVRQQWSTPVWGPALAEAQRDSAYGGRPDHHSAYGGLPDHFYTEGDSLPGGLRPLKLAGMWRGDHALLWEAPTGDRVLFSGDVLNGQVEPELVPADHFRLASGLYFGARPAYVARHSNPAALKASLERLLQEEFTMIAGSHARPFHDNAKDALARLIGTM